MTNLLQQGHGDGLCGLYAVANFLPEVAGWKRETAKDRFWYLFDSARHFGWLTPDRLIYGFENYQIREICNYLFSSFDLPYQALLVEQVQIGKDEDRLDWTRRLLGAGCRLIAGPDGHWILLTQRDGKNVIVDSDNADRPLRDFSGRNRSIQIEGGVLIRPSTTQKIDV